MYLPGIYFKDCRVVTRMNLNRPNRLLWSKLFSDFHCSYVCKNQQHVCICLHICNHETGKLHTRMQAYSPAPQAGFLPTTPTGQQYNFLTLASWYFFSLLPRDLLFPLICLLSVLERKAYAAQHTPGAWSHSKIWVLIPPPLCCLSLLLVHVFVQVCVCVQPCASIC